MLVQLLIFVLGLAAGAGAVFLWYRRYSVTIHDDTALLPVAPVAPEETIQSRLQNIEEEFDALLAFCGAGVLIINSENIIQRANVEARYLLGIPTINMIGKSLLQGTLCKPLYDLVLRARASRTLQRCEVHATGSSGCTLLASVAPIPGQPMESASVIIIFHDITELRRLETVRRDFVANVSHELRTPLTSIRGMAESLQDGALEETEVAHRFLDIIVQETERLSRLAEGLLSLTRSESQNPERTYFSISELCTQVIERFRTQTESIDIVLSVEIPPYVEAFADRDQIEQVLINLLDNAIKYSAKRVGAEVSLVLEKMETGITVSVHDNGIGIMTQDIPRIFERFYRVDKSRDRKKGGSGLGLSIVKHIVEAHGGTVCVESAYNHGSTFTFTLLNPTLMR